MSQNINNEKQAKREKRALKRVVGEKPFARRPNGLRVGCRRNPSPGVSL